MTRVYDEPARPCPFGPLLGTDIVARQAEALVARYDLLDALAAGGTPRRDLDPTTAVDYQLREAMLRQLVPWVDYVPNRSDDDAGWPIASGVRVEAFCYSPWLDALRPNQDALAGRQVFAPPASVDEFADQFRLRAGLNADHDIALGDGFRLTPHAVGRVAMDIRGSGTSPTRAFLLLLCRHFDLALQADQRLKDPHPALVQCGFQGPAILAFERLAEIARIGCIVREVDRHAETGIKLRALLEAANDPAFIAAAPRGAEGIAYSLQIAQALAGDRSLLTLCEFLAVGTDVLASWRNGVVAGRGQFLGALRVEQVLTTGGIVSDTAIGLAWSVDVRTAFLSVFRQKEPAGPGSRQSALENDILFKFYGLTGSHDNLGSALLDGLRSARPAGRPTKGTPVKQVDDDAREAVKEIARALGRDGRAPRGLQSDGAKLGGGSLNSVRTGSYLSRLYLPECGQPGAAPRGDETMWRDRYRDQTFWANVYDWDEAFVAGLGLSAVDAKRLQRALQAFDSLRTATAPLAGAATAVRAAADLATGVSPITIDPALARGIMQLSLANVTVLERASASRRATLSPKRRAIREKMIKRGWGATLGTRQIPGLEGFTKKLLTTKRQPGDKKRPR